MSTKEIQWKNGNNNVAESGYIRAVITKDDCPIPGSMFYIATIPKGTVVLGLLAYTVGAGMQVDGVTPATTNINVSIGTNNCVVCTQDLVLSDVVAGCSDSCKCTVLQDDYLVRITVPDGFTGTSIETFINVFNPEWQECCAIEPVRLCTATLIVEPCTDESCPSGSGSCNP